MSLSVHRAPREAVAGKGGSIGAHEATTRHRHAPAAATTSSDPSSPEGAGPAPPSWQPLHPSLQKRCRVSTITFSDPATSRRSAARMTCPPERTPRRPGAGLGGGGGGAVPSPKPRDLTREEDCLRLVGSLRSGPQPWSLADADTDTNTSAARVPPRRRGSGIHTSTSSTAIRSSALTGTPKGWPQASAASPVGSAPSPLSALATASHGSRRQSRTTKQPTGTRGDAPLRTTAKLPTATGTPRSLPPLPLQTTKSIPAESPTPQTDPAPPPSLPAAFGHRIVEVIYLHADCWNNHEVMNPR
jgi:hypothetical protein